MARRRWFERHAEARRRLARPVVSVGNLRAGGSGKTPLVALLARWLRDRGERPSILSRGYGRRANPDGVVVVSDGRHVCADLDRAGDEPLMLARALDGVAVLACPIGTWPAAWPSGASGARCTCSTTGISTSPSSGRSTC